MEERTGILAKALERYGIGRSLPDGQILALLEKEHLSGAEFAAIFDAGSAQPEHTEPEGEAEAAAGGAGPVFPVGDRAGAIGGLGGAAGGF